MEENIIGVDIGGTNTDAVVVNLYGEIIDFSKVATTSPVEVGFENVIKSLSKHSTNLKCVIVGTTHATNALLQGQDLYKVGLIQLAGHNPDGIPTCFGMTEELKDVIFNSAITINGGYECDGREITEFSEKEATEAIRTLIKKGVEGIAVVGVFSPLYAEQELIMGRLIEEIAGSNFPYTLSHKIGAIGVVERENTTIINTSLIKSLANGFAKLRKVLDDLNIKAPLYITRNNGTMMSLEEALKYPVLTIASGPTNSFIGASKLAKINDAIIIDIGGTSSDCGIVVAGFPRRSIGTSKIAGIDLNFHVPDVISIALGGGSIVTKNQSEYKIGPKSVSFELLSKAQSFGGEILTLTDISINAEISKNFKTNKKAGISKEDAQNVMNQATKKLSKIAEDMAVTLKGNAIPIVLVGGGACLFDTTKINNAIIPKHYGVANAYGAALAEVSSSFDKIVSLEQREATIEKIEQELSNELESKGVNLKTIRVIEKSIIPFHYMPGSLARVIITSAGQMKWNATSSKR